MPIERNLRTPKLRPTIIENVSNHKWQPLLGSTFNERAANVEDVSQRRQQLLREYKIALIDESDGLDGGDLLIFSPDQTLFDGAAAIESGKFFDNNNIPPWDTWICFLQVPNALSVSGDVPVTHDILVCWVPPELLDLVDNGISVNPERCIDWARNDNNDFTKELRNLKMLS